MEKIANVVSLAGWTYLLTVVGLQLFLNREGFLSSDISSDVTVLRGIQLFQVV